MTLDGSFLRPWRLPPNRVSRFYRGGALLDRFRAGALAADGTPTQDGTRPEDWVGSATAAMLSHGSAATVDELLAIVSDRMRLAERNAVDALLDAFGGELVVHGHTPIASVLGVDPREVREPLLYGDGRVMNVDHCLFAGGPGFVTRLDSGPGSVARPAAER